MRAVIQRVNKASVTINGKLHSDIGNGLLVFLGIEDSDSDEDILWLSGKIVNLRVFKDEEGVMNRSVLERKGAILLVSQFTLHASTKKGNRAFRDSSLVSDEQKNLIAEKLSNRLTSEGLLQVRSQVHRTQLANKQEVVKKMNELVSISLRKKKSRIATRASKASKEKRLETKKRKSEIKAGRQKWGRENF